MASILFLGNSHVSAFRFLRDGPAGPADPACRIFCARGADLYFTKLEDGRLKPLPSRRVDAEAFRTFYGNVNRTLTTYLETDRPLDCVATQFTTTGGAAEIALSGLSAIFYVAGMSPYDFDRHGNDGHVSEPKSHPEMARRLLDDCFFLRQQITDIRKAFPDCRHYLIGRPLAARRGDTEPRAAEPGLLGSRRDMDAWRRSFLFDDVYRPSETVLDRSLRHTRREFCVDGRQEADRFQRKPPTGADHEHMNQAYGRAVFDAFVAPLVSRLRDGRG